MSLPVVLRGLRQLLSRSPIRIEKRTICKSIIVKGLPSNTTREQMEERFLAYGKILDVRFIAHAEKFKTCSGLIIFEHMHSALQVVDELQHALVFGRRIQIEFNRFHTTRLWAPSTHCKEFKDMEKEKSRRDRDNNTSYERESQRTTPSKLQR